MYKILFQLVIFTATYFTCITCFAFAQIKDNALLHYPSTQYLSQIQHQNQDSISSILHNAQNTNLKISVVEIEFILEKSIAMQNIKKAVDNMSETIQLELTKKLVQLKEAEAELIKERGVISTKAFEEKVMKFHQMVSQAQNLMQHKKSSLEQAHGQAVNVVYQEIIAIIAEIAKKEGINLVLPTSTTLYISHEINITPYVLRVLNNRLKDVRVKNIN